MRLNQDAITGLICSVIALVALFIWIPLDVESGIIEKVRSRKEIGDSMAPSLAAVILLFAGLTLFFQSCRQTLPKRLNTGNFKYILGLIGFFAVVIILMRWTGPLIVSLVSLFDSSIGGYRELRDTLPWKYLGYCIGGTLLIFGLISFIEQRLRWNRLLIAFSATLVLAMFYDLPFEDLLLPPNGDV